MTGSSSLRRSSSSSSKALQSALHSSRATVPAAHRASFTRLPHTSNPTASHSQQIPALRHFSNTAPPKMPMPATGGHSQPCCNIPPVVSKGYEAKGTYETIGGYKTYVTGPKDADKAIIAIYDIFGYFDQTLQGADILAHSNDNQKYKVYIPDWFEGQPCPIEWYPPDTKEKEKNLGEFFGKHPPPSVAEKVPKYVQAVKDSDNTLTNFGIVGYCWGGKVVALSIKEITNPFVAAASVHPAMVDPADAEGVKIPFAMLASKDEPADDVKKFEDALSVPKHVEIFGDQIHGWMAARADLSDNRVKEEYERGYKTLVEFFGSHM